jgi:hypothetical protein
MGPHIDKTNEIMARNRRIGCSMSGTVDAIAKFGRTAFMTQWCEQGYKYIQYLDKKYSDWLGVRESIKKTSMKPSGTVSLVAGVYGPGAHFPKRTGYRLMRLAANWPGLAALKEAGYRIEPAISDPTGTMVAYFPWLVPEGAQTVDDATLWEQVKMAADLQYWWADNQVSYTAEFDENESPARVLSAFDGQLKGISFLKKNNSQYAQMPYTVAPREEVIAYAASLSPIVWDHQTHDMDDKFCDGGKCTIDSPMMAQ